MYKMNYMVNCIYFYNCMLELGDVEKMLKVDCIFLLFI